MLLVRELLTGPKRFGDLQASLRGLGTGLLAARLKHLEREGLAHRVTLPPPARTPAYALTEAGEELGPAILALARWGMTWAMDERRPEETFHPGWAVLGMRAYFDAGAAVGFQAVYEFRVDDEVFHIRVDDGEIEALHGPAQHPDATVTIDADAFLQVAGHGLTLAQAVKTGAASVAGTGPRCAGWRRSSGCRPRGTGGRSPDPSPMARALARVTIYGRVACGGRCCHTGRVSRGTGRKAMNGCLAPAIKCC